MLTLMAAPDTFHQQLIAKLRALIRQRKLKPGDRFLTEREIAARYRTSRPTANKALSSLVSEGLLEVRRGSGTYLREQALDYDLERLVSFTDKARAAGRQPGTKLLVFNHVMAGDAPAAAARALNAQDTDTLIYMERLRLADDAPVIHERRHVAAALCPGMNRAAARGSLYAWWTTACGLTITGAEEVIHAVNATREQAALLQIKPGAACFQITATGFAGTQPLWHEVTLYRADVYEFRNRLGGPGTGRAALGTLIK